MSLPTSAHRAALLLGLVAALAGAATPASAATVSQEGDALVYRAAPGELNRVYLNGSYNPAGRFRIEDSTADITDLPATCTRRAIDMVDCDVPGRVRVELGDGNDVVGFSEDYAFSIPVEVFGGDGDDRLDGDHRADRAEVLRGEGGRDVLTGFGGNDQLFGGPGNDDLDGRGGNDEVRGEDGDDKVSGDGQAAPGADVVDGGPGNDQVQEYVEYGVDVHPPADISLDGQANDGRAARATTSRRSSG
jgi:Ca2+-binding RTX toxin-like protein